jgi:hypothetical protein
MAEKDLKSSFSNNNDNNNRQQILNDGNASFESRSSPCFDQIPIETSFNSYDFSTLNGDFIEEKKN